MQCAAADAAGQANVSDLFRFNVIVKHIYSDITIFKTFFSDKTLLTLLKYNIVLTIEIDKR